MPAEKASRDEAYLLVVAYGNSIIVFSPLATRLLKQYQMSFIVIHPYLHMLYTRMYHSHAAIALLPSIPLHDIIYGTKTTAWEALMHIDLLHIYIPGFMLISLR